MASQSQNRSRNLGPKLLQIRNALGLSQAEMLLQLGAEQSLKRSRISEYESGKREPSLRILLAYGRVAQIHVEILLDDEATLPDKLPGDFNFDRYKKSLLPRHV